MEKDLNLIKELRMITSAGIQDCADALKEAENNLQKAIDLLKIKGKNIASDRTISIPTEGIVAIDYWQDNKCAIMIEVNCQTDFVAKNSEFIDFVKNDVIGSVKNHLALEIPFACNEVHLEEKRQILVSKFKENIVIRRWWIEQALDSSCRVFSYVHTGGKLASVLTLKSPSVERVDSKEFTAIGSDLVMQIVAMNPLVISPEQLPSDLLNRQKSIFQAQIQKMNKPQHFSIMPKIIEGKMNSWYSEVCLLKQKSILNPKSTIEQLIKNDYSHQLGGELQIVNFIRCEVGQGLEKQKDDAFAIEVSKLSGIPASECQTHEKGVCNHSHTS